MSSLSLEIVPPDVSIEVGARLGRQKKHLH